MKKLPTSVSVFGQKYKVKILKKVISEIGNELHGDFCYKTKTIRIEEDKIKVMEQTLLHECVHALAHRLAWNQGDLSHDLEEIIAETMSTWIMETFDFKWK